MTRFRLLFAAYTQICNNAYLSAYLIYKLN
jgi:hypothetical protein